MKYGKFEIEDDVLLIAMFLTAWVVILAIN